MNETSLHEFMGQNRDRILRRWVEKMKSGHDDALDVDRSSEHLGAVLDEIVAALKREAGLSDHSPLPGASDAAGRLGADGENHGGTISRVPLDIGTISDTVGELGTESGLSFAAGEYRTFNQCIDSAVASALEQFWTRARASAEAAATQRIGFLAHELRNAIASGRMALTLLQRGELGLNSRTGKILARSLDRLEALVNQTLLEVQLHSTKRPEPKRLDLAKLLREIQDAAVTERDERTRLEITEPLEVEADEQLLLSAVGNLLQNAIKFTCTGGTIVVRGVSDPAAVTIEVEDRCGGLPPTRYAEQFQPYVQLARGTDPRGLGLGLVITREAVTAQGGELLVRNLPGKGCVFAIRFPRVA